MTRLPSRYTSKYIGPLSFLLRHGAKATINKKSKAKDPSEKPIAKLKFGREKLQTRKKRRLCAKRFRGKKNRRSS